MSFATGEPGASDTTGEAASGNEEELVGSNSDEEEPLLEEAALRPPTSSQSSTKVEEEEGESESPGGAEGRGDADSNQNIDPFNTDPARWGQPDIVSEKVRIYWAKMGPESCQNRGTDVAASEQNQRRLFFPVFQFLSLENYIVYGSDCSNIKTF